MKKEYKKPYLKLSEVDLSSLCQVIGNVSGGSGSNEGEEELTKGRQEDKNNSDWGSLW